MLYFASISVAYSIPDASFEVMSGEELLAASVECWAANAVSMNQPVLTRAFLSSSTGNAYDRYITVFSDQGRLYQVGESCTGGPPRVLAVNKAS